MCTHTHEKSCYDLGVSDVINSVINYLISNNWCFTVFLYTSFPLKAFLECFYRGNGQIDAVVSSHFDLLYPTGLVVPDPHERLPGHVSFAGMGSFEQDFGAELYMRHLYRRMSENGKKVIFLDEFHHLSRRGSIVEQMLREYRASGHLVCVSQFISDVDPSMFGNFGIILVGNSTNPLDLAILEKIDKRLPSIVSRLPAYSFLNLREFLAVSGKDCLYKWIG